MTLRVILAPLLGDAADAAALDAGLALAGRHAAHLAALFVRIDPRDAVPIVGEGISPAIIEQLTQSAEAEMDRQRTSARAAFEAACARSGMALADAPADAAATSAAWHETTGRRDETIARRARTSDLVVLARAAGEASLDAAAVLEATLMSGGRPLLLLPPEAPPTLGERPAIAWNGRAEAARALAGALPLLARAGAVRILCAVTRRTDPRVADELATYLAWHGIAATPEAVDPAGQPVGEALLQAAAAAGADLLVMGGYGRTRLSELVLGGVTRHMLAQARLPLLLAH